MKPLRTTIVFGLLFVTGTSLTACDEATISESDAREYVASWNERAQKSLAKQVPVADASERFEKVAKEARASSDENAARSEPPYEVLLADVYEEVGWKTRLVGDRGLSPRGERLWAVVSNADAQAIETGGFPLDRVRELREAIEKLNGEIETIGGYEPSEREKKAARRWLQKQKVSAFELTPDNYERLAEAVIEARPEGPLARKMAKLEEVYVERANALAKLEYHLAESTLRYTRKLAHFRVRHVFVHEREDDYWRLPQTEGERPDEAKGPYVAGKVWRRAAKIADEMKDEVAMLRDRMRTSLRAVLTEDDPEKVLRELEPDHPQYAKLKEEYRRYRKIVEQGGWSEVPDDPYLDPGDRDETVEALKKRLQIEGYFPEDATIDQNYGEPLEKAVEAYQKTHQMKVTGEPHDVFWTSINKPAEYRSRQIGLNLKRWRESNVRHSDPLYVLVNIPGFRTEVWKHGERKMRFRIVVGNDKSTYDKEKKETVNPNHTPELSAYIDRVIYNPYWNVTDRIRKTEILPKVRRSVEQKYKAKLRELRREQQSGVFASSGGGVGSFLVAQGGNSASSSSSANDGSNSANASETASSGGLFGLGGETESSDSNASDSSAAQQDASSESPSTSGDGENTSSESGKKNSKPEVSIGDLYEMVEVENSMMIVDKKAVFDVAKIRKLIEKSNKSDGGSGGMFGGGSTTAAKEESPPKKSGESAAGEKKPTSPLEKKFPYLDPKTGEVDVSTTDPDNIPSWYEENNYEVVFPGKKWEYVRMKQGNDNALGRVKVIFPNKYSVYLHDTPKTHLFERNVRAFSHGCMRMNKPLEFAKFLLEEDGSFDEIDLDSILHEKKKVRAKNDPDKKWKMTYEYRPVFLQKQIPVHVEYFTVRVGSEGRAHFFADVYDKDAKLLDDEG